MYRPRAIETRNASPSSRRRLRVILLTLVFAASGFNILGASAASAACPVESDWAVTAYSDGWFGTNVSSDWLTGPGTITRTVSTTATDSSSQSASVGVSYGTIIAKAEAKYSKDWSTSTSKSQSWSYSKSIPSGETARVIVRKRGSRFTFKKYTINSLCQTTWSQAYYQYSPYASTASGQHCYGKDKFPATADVMGTSCDSA